MSKGTDVLTQVWGGNELALECLGVVGIENVLGARECIVGL